MSYRTIILPFTVYGEQARLLLYTAGLWKAGVQRVINLVKEQGEQVFQKSLTAFKTAYYKEAYKIIPDKFYAESCCELVYEIGKSLIKLREYWRKKLGKDLPVTIRDVELSDWIIFESRGCKQHLGNQNIRVLDLEHVRVKVFDCNGNKANFVLHVGKPKSQKFRLILKELIELANRREVAYNARVYIRDALVDVVKGEVQVVVPYEIYSKYYPKFFDINHVHEYVLGFDVNFDRIDVVLIDLEGRLKYFEELDMTPFVTQGRYWKDARTYVAQWLHRLYNLVAQKYGTFIVAIEDPDVLGLLKLRWIVFGRRLSTDYNYKVMRFSSGLSELIIDVAEKLGIRAVRVDPKGTTNSEEHNRAMKELRLNRHQASAYLIAKRALNKQQRTDSNNVGQNHDRKKDKNNFLSITRHSQYCCLV